MQERSLQRLPAIFKVALHTNLPNFIIPTNFVIPVVSSSSEICYKGNCNIYLCRTEDLRLIISFLFHILNSKTAVCNDSYRPPCTRQRFATSIILIFVLHDSALEAVSTLVSIIANIIMHL
jgi:hypothetical protein